MDNTNRRKVEQDHESVSEADLEEQLRSRDEQLANGRQVVCTETEDETGDQRMEEQLDDETVGEETEDEADDGSDNDREDDERNEEEDDEMDEEKSGGKERDEADECVDRKKSAVYRTGNICCRVTRNAGGCGVTRDQASATNFR